MAIRRKIKVEEAPLEEKSFDDVHKETIYVNPTPTPVVKIDNNQATGFNQTVMPKTNNMAKSVVQPTEEIDDTPIYRVTKPHTGGAHSERILLPSNNIFYGSFIGIKPFDIPNLAKISKAIKNKDDRMFNDVLDSTIDCDIRDLCQEDVQFIMYWQRLNSYTSLPYTVNWTSFYGNKNRFKAKKTDIRYDFLTVTPEEYAGLQAKGITYPTLRDIEEYFSYRDKLDEEDSWLYTRAKYLVGSSIAEKLEIIKSGKYVPDDLITIKDFANKIQACGIREATKAKDENFVAIDAIEYLNERLVQIQLILESSDITEAQELIYTDMFKETNDEIVRIKTALLETGEAEPMLETIPINISAFDFFPGV